MKNYISYDRLSKKEKRKVDLARRKQWSISPVSRVVIDKKKEANKRVCRDNNQQNRTF